MSVNKKQVDYSLYLVTDRGYLRGRDLCQMIAQAIEGGVTVVQLREKTVSTLEFFQIALRVQEITRKYEIPLIINDRLDIAQAINSDGLHIGQDDLPLPIARRILGDNKIIGVSVSTIEEALLAQEQGADYLGVGAIFSTFTKTDAKLVSIEQLQLIKKTVAIPVVAIGGINETNIQRVMPSGINGISVVSAILDKDDPRTAATQLRHLLN